MIKQPGDYNSSKKRFRMLIAGYPGIGKSTLALSSPNPLWIDVDRGFDRVEAKFRKPFIQPEDYQELLDDLIPQNTADFDTLVFDTGGQMIELMKPYVIKQNAQNGQRDGSLSLKGYGAVSREFKRLMDYCFYTLNKNIIVLFHAKEEKDGDSMLIGDLPVIYNESTGTYEHIAYYMGGIGGYECIHSSASKGCVCGTTLKNGFTHVLRHRLISGVPVSSIGNETIEETEESTMTQYTSYGIVTTDGGNLNLRSAASTSSAILARIPCGEKIKILADKGSWYRVSYEDSVGYVSAEFVTLETTENTTSDEPTAAGGEGNWGVFIPCASREKADEFAEHFAVGVVCQRECDD